jgi:hypothetical protein
VWGAARGQNFIHAPKRNTRVWRFRGRPGALFSHQSWSFRLAWIDISTPKPVSSETAEVPP